MNLLASWLRLAAVSLWSVIMLTATMVAVLLRPGTTAYWTPASWWIRGILAIVRVRLVVEGRENLDPGQTYVVMANHRSQLDPVAMGVAFLPRITRWVAKQELRRVPVLGRALELTGQIFVDRGDRQAALSSLTSHEHDRDAMICFFPEGHRSSSRNLLPFKKGAAGFAIASGMWVLPTAVSGSERCLPSRSIRSRPGTIRVVFGAPIDTAGMTEADRGRLTEAARGEIVRLLEAIEGPLSDGHRTGGAAGPEAPFRGADGPDGHGAAPKSA